MENTFTAKVTKVVHELVFGGVLTCTLTLSKGLNVQTKEEGDIVRRIENNMAAHIIGAHIDQVIYTALLSSEYTLLCFCKQNNL